MNRSVTLRLLLSGFAAALLAAPADADILYRFREGVLFDGKHGPIAKAQASANAALIACGKPGTITADGKFGRGTRDARSCRSPNVGRRAEAHRRRRGARRRLDPSLLASAHR